MSRTELISFPSEAFSIASEIRRIYAPFFSGSHRPFNSIRKKNGGSPRCSSHRKASSAGAKRAPVSAGLWIGSTPASNANSNSLYVRRGRTVSIARPFTQSPPASILILAPESCRAVASLWQRFVSSSSSFFFL